MKASHIIGLARILLSDLAKVRWTDAELLGWLNGGQLAIVSIRPDAKATSMDFTLVEGVEQALPTGALRLLEITRNVGGPAITLVTRDHLNQFDPDWYSAEPVETIRHYTYTTTNPLKFEVVPPAVAGTVLRGVAVTRPVDCADVNADIDLDDLFESPLVDWVCYRAFSKDSDSAVDGARAGSAYATYESGLMGKTQSDSVAKPDRSKK